MDPVHGGLLIIIALVLYAIFYFTHGRYLQNKVVKADPNKPTPAQRLYDGVDYVPANKYVLYGHHFASIAGAGPIVGPAIALGWGWLPAILWVWFGNVFVGVVHDYLALMASVRYDGKSIGWVAGELMGRKTMYIFNSYIWFSLLLVVAAFGFVISTLFSGIPGAGLSALLLLFFAVITGYLMYKTSLGVKGGTPIAWIFIIIAVFIGIMAQEGNWFDNIWFLQYFKDFNTWIYILLIYIIVAASIPVWVLLQPRDYMNAYILWASLAIGGGAMIWLFLQGGAGNLVFPGYTTFTANIVGGMPSPFWPAVPLIIACGALSGFHSLVGSGTSSKQLANELHGLTVAYAGMETEGFLSTMVIATIAAFGVLAFADTIYAAVSGGNTAVTNIVNSIASDLGMKPVTADNITKDYAQTLMSKFADTPSAFGKYYAKLAGKLKWTIIPKSYAYATNKAFGLSLTAMTIFGTLWITGFALTSLDTATRLGRYAWQELMSPLKKSAPGLYKVIANKWVASAILALIGMWLAASKQFLLLWPAFAGMNQLLSSLALMTVAVWVAKVQKASSLGKALVVAPAIFMWITVTIALLWFEYVVVYPKMLAGELAGIIVGVITAIGIILNLLIFALWIRRMRK
ncbi:carbon starvation protein A [Desulfurococcaceae archaeon MEX13E-LK6-19]|nr:carbon starvation protein A [Desulfurococcaceae archaeon MEX13E-LK6-19]